MSADTTIEKVISNLNKFGIKIVMIINKDEKLEGTISDGDIRRALLRGLDLNSPITSAICRSTLVVPPELNRELVMQLMLANKIQQVPIVDADRNIVGLHLWDEISAPVMRSNLMVIMAGGKGTRLYPHTENCPKPLVPVAGKPILEHIIQRAKHDGFTRFIIAINHLGHMIEAHFGDGKRLGVHIDYLREKFPLGTAGALGLLSPLPVSSIVVTNGDVLTDIRYSELLDFHIFQDASATMAVRLYDWQHPFGVVQTRGIDIVGFEEKPISRTYINAGVYALKPAALSFLDANVHCDMPTLFERLKVKSKRMVAYPMHEPWLDVGRPDDLRRACLEMSIKTKTE